MRIGYLDCFSGVSGDMWVGALLDLGLPLQDLEPAIRSLDLPGVAVRSEKVLRAGLAGTRFLVDIGKPAKPIKKIHLPAAHGHAHPHVHPHSHPHLHGEDHAHPHEGPHRHLADIEAILARADLPAPVREDCRSVFHAIAEAESRAHAQPVESVHFHEVGAEDTIVDIVCACLGTHLLGLERLYSSAVVVGSGTVRCAHGELPVPAPGTLDILFGVPVRVGKLPGERTTPTGAALLKVLVDEFEPAFTWLPGARGYGAGTRDDAEHPNLLRITTGEMREPGSAAVLQEITCNLDTATGETLGWLLDALLAAGAVDAFATPLQMKKGRPGFMLTALCDDARADDVTRLLLEESSTLGVRAHRVQRALLERWQETVDTPFGPVRFKAARLPSGHVLRRPEDDEVARLCAAHHLGRAELLRRLTAGPAQG